MESFEQSKIVEAIEKKGYKVTIVSNRAVIAQKKQITIKASCLDELLTKIGG